MKTLKSLFNPYMGLPKEIYIIFISRTINAMGALIFPFMTLLLNNKIGLTNKETGFYVALVGIFYAPASLIGGKLSDSYGRKKVLIIFEILAMLCYLICVFLEPNMLMVYTLLCASFFFGVAGPSHDAMIADLTNSEQRQGAYSMSYLGFNLGFALAQILAGYLFKDFLALMFIIDAFTAFIGILLIAFFVKETHSREKKIEIVNQKLEKSIFSVLFARPILIFFSLATFGYKFVYAQWGFLFPLHAEFNFPGEGAKLFGVLGSFNALLVLIFTPLLTGLLIKNKNIKNIFYAGILFTVGFGLLGFISVKAALFLSVFIFTMGEILEATNTMPFIMDQTPETHRGRMSSIIPLIMGAGYALGPLVMGNILGKSNFQYSWIFAATIVLISTISIKGLDVSIKRSGQKKSRTRRPVEII